MDVKPVLSMESCKQRDVQGDSKKVHESKDKTISYVKLSDTVSHLSGESRQRYVSKLKQLGVADPYVMPTSMFTDVLKCSAASLPDFAYPDLYNYLVNNPSPYTGKDMKAYKSLDAYQYFVAGWVSCVQQWECNDRDYHLIMAKVS